MRTTAALMLLAVLGLANQSTTATDCAREWTCCDQCGCYADCVQKTCQVVSDVKKETKTRWHVECQEFCPLMPGSRNGCDGCQPPPRCGHPKVVKKLVKKEYQVEVPIYKCVVRNLCFDCCQGGEATVADAAPAPNPPPAPALPSIAPAMPIPMRPPSPK